MQLTFWLFAILLVLITLAWPLRALRQRHQEAYRTEQVNLAIYRERLDELKADLRNGTLEQAQFDEAKEELARALLYDLKADEHQAQPGGKLRRIQWPVMAAVAVIVPLLALITFHNLSDRIHFVSTPPGANSAESREASGESRQLLAQIQQQPRAAGLWSQLGERYMQMQRPYEAQQAYQRARELGQEDPDLLIRLAHAIGQIQNGELRGEPARLIQQALTLDPNHRPSLIWAGLLNFQKGDFEAALAFWRQVQEQLSPQAPQREMLDRLIAQAHQRMTGSTASMPSAAPPREDSQPDGGTARIAVAVKLDPALEDRVTPDQALFILARAANGPPMPLAVVRRQAKDLPIEVTLDDSQAMTPQMRLSSFDEVVVVARISRSGQAIAQPGDMFAESGPLPVAETGRVQLTIDRVVEGE